jgi:predicted transcriptional regulator
MRLLSILGNGPAYFAEIINALPTIHCGDTRAGEVRKAIEEMVCKGIVATEGDWYNLTKLGAELAAAERRT